MLDRRRFLGELASLAVAFPEAGFSAARSAPALRVLYLHDPSRSVAGAEFGAEEARRAATLLGGQVDVQLSSIESGNLDRIAAISREANVTAVVLALTAGQPLPHDIDDDGTVLLDTRLRRAPDELPRPRLFHLGAGANAPAAAELWRPTLERFGAAQLNRRFQQRTGRGMGSSDWADWFALKLLWEASLRADTVNASALAAYLLSTAARFDGHKGEPLRFRPGDHQLEQPLYALAGRQVS